MATQVEPGDDGAAARLQGALGLLNVLIGIRMRGVVDPESRRHLIWLNDVVAGLGLWNRRAVAGRYADFADYLEAAAAFWSRAGRGRHVSIDRPSGSVALPDITAASLSIITHELLGAAVALERPVIGDGATVLSFEITNGVLYLSVSSPGAPLVLADESRAIVQGLAEYLGGRLVVDAQTPHLATVAVPTHLGVGVRH